MRLRCRLRARSLERTAAWVFWHVRDRHAGYAVNLDLRIPPNAAPLPLRVGFGRMRITPDLSHTVWLAGFDNGRLVALELKTGKLVWETPIAVPRGRSDLERMATDNDWPDQW